MGSNDVPPPHVPAHVVPVRNFFLQIGGSLWTICYVLYVRESFRSKSYGMPLFALALNFAWELVYALVVSEALLERAIFTLWLLIDCGMVYGMILHAHIEWSHSPRVASRIGLIFLVFVTGSTLGHWTFAKWWIDNNIGQREGKFYRGVIGPDTTELGFWSAAICQVYLSGASLCQLVVRQHSGGVSWSIWTTRTLGSIIGFYLVYGWEWYFWPEAHEYFMSPFALFLWTTSIICDFAYAYILRDVQRHEKILPDGRRIAATDADVKNMKKL